MTTNDNPFLWYYGTDEECMTLFSRQPDSLEAATLEILSGGYYGPGDTVYLIEANKATTSKFSADLLLENWIDQNEDCWGEDWPTPSKKAITSLQVHLDAWMQANPQLLPEAWSFGTIRQRREITIPAPPETDQ